MIVNRRQFGRHIGMAALATELLALPSTADAASGGTKAFDVTPYVHPELRPVLASLAPLTANVPTMATLPEFRKRLASFGGPVLPRPVWSERIIPGPAGAPDVRIYIVNARPDGSPRPAILHTHGGGFFAGDAKSNVRGLQDIAQSLDCVIVSVDYRLAPETRFPGSLEDNYAGLKWLHDNAAEIGVDPRRIAVMGESAGGGHAAMLAIAARDRGEIPLVYQALIYPMLDDRTASVHQKPPFMGGVLWTPAHNRFGWSALLGMPAGGRTIPYGSVPARLDDLRGLPPAFIGVGSIDLFLDEDVDYARRLMDAGVATELHVVPGAFHAFDLLAETAIGSKFHATLLEAMRSAFSATV